MAARTLACALLPLGGMFAASDDPSNTSQLVKPVNVLLPGNVSGNQSHSTAKVIDFAISSIDEPWVSLPLVSMGGSPSLVEADGGDVQRTFGDAAVKGVCRRVCNGGWTKSEFSVNKNGSPHRAYITQGAVQWSGMKKRSMGRRQVNQQTVTNNVSWTVEQEVKLISNFASSLQISTTNTIEVGREISVEVDIPEVFKMTSTGKFTFSTAQTRTMTETATQGTWNTLTVPVPGKSQVCVHLTKDHETFDATFTVPVCYTGYFRCDYFHKRFWWWVPDRYRWEGYRCQPAGRKDDAATWYAPFKFGFPKNCRTLRGKVVGNTYTNANGFVTRGPCPRQLSASGVAAAATAPALEQVAQQPLVLV